MKKMFMIIIIKNKSFYFLKITVNKKYNSKKSATDEEYYLANLEKVKARKRVKSEFMKKSKEEYPSQCIVLQILQTTISPDDLLLK